MIPTREAIYTALLAKLKTTASYLTVGRRFIMPQDIQDSMLPALFMVQLDDEYRVSAPNLPKKVWLHVDAFVWTAVQNVTEPIGQETVFPQIGLNNALDAIDQVLQPDDLQRNLQTLGGLVQHCFIEGKIQTDQGLYFPKAMAIVPINILVGPVGP